MSKYFKPKETQCSCCGLNFMDEEFMEAIDAIREEYGAPMIVSSGYRCVNHPIEAAKRAPGPHNTGMAIDILCHGAEAYRLIRLALSIGMRGIGINQKGDIDQRFIHLDDCDHGPNRPRPWIWSY